MRSTFSLICVLLLGSLLSGQSPVTVPPGWVLVDDMVLPASVILGDGGYTATPWPFGVVPYTFDPNVTPANQQLVLAAMAEIEGICRATFVPRGSEANFLRIRSANQNSSAVGMIGGAQDVNIVSFGSRFIIVHELLHALGHLHEQQRPDRDLYVAVQWANIAAQCGSNLNQSCNHNFDINLGATPVGPYDFLSLMHYAAGDFSANGQPTLVCQPNFASFQGMMGQRQYLSLGDAQALQQRYFAPFPPSADVLVPTNVAPGSGAFTLNIYGSRFYAGSSAPGAGVQGTRVLWNGTPLSTTWINEGQLQVAVPSSLVLVPGTATLVVENPAPGGGQSNTKTLTIGCPSSATLALTPGAIATATLSCTPFTITPAANWNVIACSSASGDWDLGIGAAASANLSQGTDLVAANGYRSGGAAAIAPTTGGLSLTSGSGTATVETVTATSLSAGQVVLGTLPAGSIVRAFAVQGSAASLRVETTGDPALKWALLSDYAVAAGWRSLTTDVIASGQVGGGAVAGIAAPTGLTSPLFTYCLVIYRDGGPATTSSSFTVTYCFDTQAINLSQGVATITGTLGLCSPVTLTPQANRWNAVGVTSLSDYDISMGNTVSQLGGSQCDYLIQDGHLQQSVPTTGSVVRYSGVDVAHATHATTYTVPTFPGFTYGYGSMLTVFEFLPVVMGNYDLMVTAPPGFRFDFHHSGASGQWRTRSQATSSGHLADGSPVRVQVGGGWHAVVVYRDGGALPGVPPTINFSSVLAAVQPPEAFSLAPSSAPALSGPVSLSVTGAGFTPSAQVRWNGAGLSTTFVSATELSATVDAALLQNPGSALVSVNDPQRGVSGSLLFAITNPVPVINSFAPNLVLAGDPGFNLTLVGSGFVPGVLVHFETTTLSTIYVSPTEVVAAVPSTLIEANGAFSIVAQNPFSAPSSAVILPVYAPFLLSVTPSSIPVQSTAPETLVVSGAYIRPGSVVYADGVPLPTTWVSEYELSATFDPSLFPQVQEFGGVALSIAASEVAVSNPAALIVGGGSNRGVVRLQPLAPAPGTSFEIWVEENEGLFAQPVTLAADLGNPTTLSGWPTLAEDMVLGILNGSAGPLLPLADGLGILGPPDGSAFEFLNYGGWIAVGPFVMPPVPLGISVKLQAAYGDPTAPLGFRLTWTRNLDL